MKEEKEKIKEIFSKIDKKHFVITDDGTKGVSFTLNEWNQLKSEIQEIEDNLKKAWDLDHDQCVVKIQKLDKEIERLVNILHIKELNSLIKGEI